MPAEFFPNDGRHFRRRSGLVLAWMFYTTEHVDIALHDVLLLRMEPNAKSDCRRKFGEHHRKSAQRILSANSQFEKLNWIRIEKRQTRIEATITFRIKSNRHDSNCLRVGKISMVSIPCNEPRKKRNKQRNQPSECPFGLEAFSLADQSNQRGLEM